MPKSNIINHILYECNKAKIQRKTRFSNKREPHMKHNKLS